MQEGKTISVLIVSRHPAAIEFIRQVAHLDADTPVMTHATVGDVSGCIVYGNVPMHLAAAAHAVVAVEFASEPPRGREYSVEDMYASGASLRVYQVTNRSNVAGAGLASVAVELDDSDGEPWIEIDSFGRCVAPGSTQQLAQQQADAITMEATQ